MALARNGRVALRWIDGGNPAGEPVLHIMGLGGTARAWARLLPYVEPEYRVLTFDHRGTGLSDPVTFPLRMADLVGDAVAVLDAAGVPRAHVHGVSLGGMVAQELALRHPERVRSLLLGCTTPGGIMVSNEPPWRLIAAAGLRPVLGAERTWPMVSAALYSRRTREEFPERIAEDEAMRLDDATPAATILAQMLAVARHDVRSRLPALAGLPVTVVHGADDVLIPPRAGRALAERIPGARLVLLDDAGHLLGTDAGPAWADAVLEHLAHAGSSTSGRAGSHRKADARG